MGGRRKEDRDGDCQWWGVEKDARWTARPVFVVRRFDTKKGALVWRSGVVHGVQRWVYRLPGNWRLSMLDVERVARSKRMSVAQAKAWLIWVKGKEVRW